MSCHMIGDSKKGKEMNTVVKNIGKLVIAVVVAALAFCLAGCQKELTGKEAVKEFRSLEPVEVFDNESLGILSEMLDLTGEMAKESSSDEQLAKYEELLNLQVKLDRICNDLLDLKGYPKACEELYNQLAETARATQEAADCYERAGFQYSLGNIVTGTKRLKEADPWAVQSGWEKYTDLTAEMMEQE